MLAVTQKVTLVFAAAAGSGRMRTEDIRGLLDEGGRDQEREDGVAAFGGARVVENDDGIISGLSWLDVGD